MGRSTSTLVATAIAFSALAGRMWVFGLVRLGTESMHPALRQGDVAWFWRLADAEVGDLVVVELPDEPGVYHVKRLVAVGPATVEQAEGVLFIDGQRVDTPREAPRTWRDGQCRERTTRVADERIGERQWEVEPEGSLAPLSLQTGELFVLGDLRGSSEDSRQWGPVHPRWVRGVASWRLPGSDPCTGERDWDRLGRIL